MTSTHQCSAINGFLAKSKISKVSGWSVRMGFYENFLKIFLWCSEKLEYLAKI